MNQSLNWGPFILQTLLATLLSGSIIGLLLKAQADRRIERSRFTRVEQAYGRLREELYVVVRA